MTRNKGSEKPKLPRNPNWEREEVILALDLYLRYGHKPLSTDHEEVIKLSNLLRSLSNGKVRTESFRNPNSVSMKLNNFIPFDPLYAGAAGLRGNSKLDKKIWDEFAHDPEYLRHVAQRIIDNVEAGNAERAEDVELEEEEFFEGRLLYRMHRIRERNKRLVEQVKNSALKNGDLKCSVCKFDFEKAYGDLGKGYIECHHTIPVSEYKGKTQVNPKDLALVCSNCHRMLHRRRPWLKPEELRMFYNEEQC